MRAAGVRGSYARGSVSALRIGDIDRAAREQRTRRRYRRYVVSVVVVLALLGCLVAGGVVLYYSDAFAVKNVKVTGVEHLTATEMTELAAVPANTTLLRVDTAAIEERLLRDAWVERVAVNRVFPDTLEIVITERDVGAVVSVPVHNGETVQEWAIAEDGTWLMAIPEQGSEASRSVSPQVYADAETALKITDVPLGANPSVGEKCTDANVNNALSIVNGMTTELADQVAQVKAQETSSTTLILENGVEIAFGEAGDTEEIRTKERVALALLEQYEGDIAYINVRIPESPTWRSS